MAFFGGGAEDAAGDFLVKAFFAGGLKGFFHAAVFAGMKGEDGDAAAGVQTLGQDTQERVEGGELLVHFDADGLKDATHGKFAFFFADSGKFAANGGGEVCGGEERLSGQGRGELGGVRLVGVFSEDSSEFFRRHLLQELRGGDASGGIHAHVERAGGFGGKAPLGVVELHGTDAEVGEDKVGAVLSEAGQRSR